uniref:Uncharacterized protein n=1 Tax=Trichinella nativa TaxID=6335 RepID=A0A0V1KJ79_9BILA
MFLRTPSRILTWRMESDGGISDRFSLAVQDLFM